MPIYSGSKSARRLYRPNGGGARAIIPRAWRRTTKVNDFAKSKPIEWFERAA
ncbi:hypothetical protein [Bradyrhizobium sp. BR 10261]|uniref:hypothetical protein n=1 Tax=Bradyrhizobium sp. BR 10261 TaxID=2749992 RepID=UPI001C64A0C0|nr:hypothetical protein [Bradyrhizobium sp. BR 10261]MBW7966559.1 hypothetical protein [Bradyrhizobium sp. BR 10261]